MNQPKQNDTNERRSCKVKIEVTEKEAESIGQRRWEKANAKKWGTIMLLWTGGMVAMMVVSWAAKFPDWATITLVLPPMAGFMWSWARFYLAMDKAGKVWVKLAKQEAKVDG